VAPRRQPLNGGRRGGLSDTDEAADADVASETDAAPGTLAWTQFAVLQAIQ
jgi:hypothetical protein